MTKSELAVQTFTEGYNCSQTVFSSFADQCGISRDLTLKISTGFGGGISRHGEVCGAVSGAVMVLGSLYGRGENEKVSAMLSTYEITQKLFVAFTEKMGAVQCKKLIHNCDILTKEGQNEFVEKGYWNDICIPCITTATVSITQLIEESK